MSKPLIMLGGGGHARVLLDMVLRLGYPILGVVDPALPTDALWQGLPVLGDDAAILQYPAADIELVNGLGSLPNDQGLRQRLFSQFQSQGYSFKTLVDPSAFVATSHGFQQGSQILTRAIIQAGTQIACNTIINSGAIVEHDCRIGQHVHIAPGAVLSGGVEVGDYVHIGTGAIIIQGIRIGSGTIIGAGSVVTQDVASNQIVYPARSSCQARNRDSA